MLHILFAEKFKQLISKGMSESDIHCIGHSLGAHACGYAGQFMGSNKIGWITGLNFCLHKTGQIHENMIKVVGSHKNCYT